MATDLGWDWNREERKGIEVGPQEDGHLYKGKTDTWLEQLA